jgi:hypothetical protein
MIHTPRNDVDRHAITTAYMAETSLTKFMGSTLQDGGKAACLLLIYTPSAYGRTREFDADGRCAAKNSLRPIVRRSAFSSRCARHGASNQARRVMPSAWRWRGAALSAPQAWAPSHRSRDLCGPDDGCVALAGRGRRDADSLGSTAPMARWRRITLQSPPGPQHHWRRSHDGGCSSMKRGAFPAGTTCADAHGVTTADSLDQNAQNAPRRASHDRYCTNATCFHTVCEKFALQKDWIAYDLDVPAPHLWRVGKWRNWLAQRNFSGSRPEPKHSRVIWRAYTGQLSIRNMGFGRRLCTAARF